MKGRIITARMIAEFKEHLILEERSAATGELIHVVLISLLVLFVQVIL